MPDPQSELEEARLAATEIFQMVLKRDPEEAAVAAYGGALDSGALSAIEMTRELMASDEFGLRASLHPAVADHLTRAVFSAVLQRSPDEATLRAFSAALQGGLGVDALISELLGSEEYRLRHGAGVQAAASPGAPSVGARAERPAAAPQPAAPAPPIEPRRSMADALAMIARRRAEAAGR